MTTSLRPVDRPAPLAASTLRPQWVTGASALRHVTDDIARPLSAWPGRGWWLCFAASSLASAPAFVTSRTWPSHTVAIVFASSRVTSVPRSDASSAARANR